MNILYTENTTSKPRIFSLDIFRGLTVVLMIIVNNPGSWSHIYSPLRHPEWDGLSLADMVFPFFLLALGMSIPLAIQRRIDRGISEFRIFIYVVSRTILIVAIGLFLNAFPDFQWEGLRLPGVLQRIGIVYIFTFIIYKYFKFVIQLLFVIIILLGYTVLTLWLPAFDIEQVGDFIYSPLNHFGAGIDRWIFGAHLWKVTKNYDPEGLFSTLPSLTNSIIGTWWTILFINSNSKHKFDLLVSNSLLFKWGFTAILFAFGFIFSLSIPLNKTIWSPSFALITSSLGFLVIIILEAYPRVFNRIFQWTIPFGTHALFVFIFIGVFSRLLVFKFGEISVKSYIWNNFFMFNDLYLSSFMYSICYFALVWIALKLYIALKSMLK